MKRRFLSILLTLALVLSLCPAHAFAAEPQAVETVQEDYPDPDSIPAYRTPEEILTKDHGFSKDEIDAMQNESYTDDRVGYAKNQDALLAHLANPLVEVIVITASEIELSNKIVIDRNISFISFLENRSTLASSETMERDSYFLEISNQDGSPITDRNVSLRFSYVDLETRHNGGAIRIKAAEKTVNSSLDNEVLVEGARIRLNCKSIKMGAAGTYSIYGEGNISVVGCIISKECLYSSGTIYLFPSKFGTITVKDCNLFHLDGSCLRFEGDYFENGGYAVVQNCNLYDSQTPMMISKLKSVEISDFLTTDFTSEGPYIGAEDVNIKNMTLAHPNKPAGGGQLNITADKITVDNFICPNIYPEFDFYGNSLKISNTEFIADNEDARNRGLYMSATSTLELENVKVSGFKYGCSISNYYASNQKITLKDCEISDCDKGLILSGQEVTLDGCRVINNAEVGINSSCSSLTITDSVICRNGYARTNNSLGGIVGGGQVTINSCKISNNYSAASGGGLSNADGTVNILGESAFTGNSAAEDGGAIYVKDPTKLTIDETVEFSSNRASTAYFPPKDAPEKYPNIKFASTSAAGHPVNNYDISYVGEDPIPVASSVDPVNIQTVPYGTSIDELQGILSSNVRSVSVRMNNGSYDSSPVTWDVLNSGYDGKVSGDYTIYGEVRVDKSKYVNPNNVKASVKVTVEDPGRLVVDKVKSLEPVEVPQYMLLGPTEKNHAIGGVPTTVNLPETVQVLLYSGDTPDIPVRWDVTGYDPTLVDEVQTIEGEFEFLSSSAISNPKNLKPTIEVTATAAQYDVLEASTDGASVEVLPGTSLAEIQTQLEEEGKAEVHVDAFDSITWDEIYTYCTLNLTEEGNPAWAEQMDAPGEYELKITLPEDFTEIDESILDESAAKVKVTVLQPLDIAEVKPIDLDAYQSVDPENLENVPEQVTAVLSNGMEIPIDVEWKWKESGYQKDLVGSQVVVGELVNLPTKARQPESGDLPGTLNVNVVAVEYEVISSQSEEEYETWALLTLEEITELLKPTVTLTISSVTPGITVKTTYEARISLETEKNPDFDMKGEGMQVLEATFNLPDNIAVPTDVLVTQVSIQILPVEVKEIEPIRIIVGEGTEFEEIEKPETAVLTFDVKGPDGEYKKETVEVEWGSGEGYNPYPEDLTEENPVEMTVYGTLAGNIHDYVNEVGVPVPLSITVVRAYEVTGITPNRFPESGSMEVKLGSTLEEIYEALDTHTVELALESMNGSETTRSVTFQLREEDNPHYDPMTEGTYSLEAFVNLPTGVSNPKDLQIEIVVKTTKYTISSVKGERIEGVVSGTAFEDVPMPSEVTVNLTGGGTDVVGVAQWDGSSYNPTKIGSQVVRGTLGELPVHLTNPNNRQPSAVVTVVNPDVKIMSLQLITGQTAPKKQQAISAGDTSVPGYREYRYIALIQQKDGTTSEEIISVYVETETNI